MLFVLKADCLKEKEFEKYENIFWKYSILKIQSFRIDKVKTENIDYSTSHHVRSTVSDVLRLRFPHNHACSVDSYACSESG